MVCSPWAHKRGQQDLGTTQQQGSTITRWGGRGVEISVTLLLATAKSLQLCPALCGPIDVSPPGSPVPGILQARTLEWVAISFSNTTTT